MPTPNKVVTDAMKWLLTTNPGVAARCTETETVRMYAAHLCTHDRDVVELRNLNTAESCTEAIRLEHDLRQHLLLIWDVPLV